MADQDTDKIVERLMEEMAALNENSPPLDADGFAEAFEATALASIPVVEPPDDLCDKVLAAAMESEMDAAPPDMADFSLAPWAMAACFAVVAGAALVWGTNARKPLEKEIVELRAQVETSDLRIRELASKIDDSFKAFIVWDDTRGTGVLKVDNLPALGDGGDYQLWVVSEGYDDPLDGGVFDTKNGKAEMQIITKKLAKDLAKPEKIILFAISRERAGGVPVSETKDFVLTASY